jgi:heme/copper-type cytochrome/quinol oxidase subunit 2
MKPSDRLIETIKQQGIQPAPKWRYSLRNALIWGVFLVDILLGALAFSVILFAIQQTDFNVLSHLSHSRLELFLGLLPLLWVIFLAGFVFVAMYAIQFSPKGYKLTLARRIGFCALLSILLGTLFFIAGGAQKLEHAFAMNVSIYDSVQEKKTRLWMMPENGYLAGEITAVGPDKISLRDFNNAQWTIRYSDETFVAPVIKLEVGEQVKLIGKMEAAGTFNAEEIRPWGGQGKRWRKGG